MTSPTLLHVIILAAGPSVQVLWTCFHVPRTLKDVSIVMTSSVSEVLCSDHEKEGTPHYG